MTSFFTIGLRSADEEKREWNQKFRDGTLKARAAERERQRQKSEARLRQAELELMSRQVEREREARSRHARNKARGGLKDASDSSDDEPTTRTASITRPPVRPVASYSKSSVLASLAGPSSSSTTPSSSYSSSSSASRSSAPSSSSTKSSSRPASSYSSSRARFVLFVPVSVF